MERKSYYEALNPLESNVNRSSIIQSAACPDALSPAGSKAARRFTPPEWHAQMDHAFAVLNDPSLTFVYDSEGERGLQATWCNERLVANLAALHQQGSSQVARKLIHKSALWDQLYEKKDNSDFKSWEVTDYAWWSATVYECTNRNLAAIKKERDATALKPVHQGCLEMKCAGADACSAPSPAASQPRRLLRLRHSTLKSSRPDTKYLVPAEPETTLEDKQVTWPASFPSAAWCGSPSAKTTS